MFAIHTFIPFFLLYEGDVVIIVIFLKLVDVARQHDMVAIFSSSSSAHGSLHQGLKRFVILL